jgi:hypothetical protein
LALQFTIVGLLARVKGMLQPSCNFPKGRKGDRSQGCADPPW